MIQVDEEKLHKAYDALKYGANVWAAMGILDDMLKESQANKGQMQLFEDITCCNGNCNQGRNCPLRK